MKYTGKWWDSKHRTERERSVAWTVTQILYGVLILTGLLMLASCEKEVVPARILDGEYSVAYKIWEYSDGTRKYYYPQGTDVTGLPITGWMAEAKYIFAGDSLGISQLMNEGWNTGYVEVEWTNTTPFQVGCHYVESVSDTQISWYQDNVIIRSILVKQ